MEGRMVPVIVSVRFLHPWAACKGNSEKLLPSDTCGIDCK